MFDLRCLGARLPFYGILYRTVHSIDSPEVDPNRFEVGAKLAQIRIMCSGGRTMEEIRAYCPSEDAWSDTLRVVYLLAQTGLVYFGMPV